MVVRARVRKGKVLKASINSNYYCFKYLICTFFQPACNFILLSLAFFRPFRKKFNSSASMKASTAISNRLAHQSNDDIRKEANVTNSVVWIQN